MPLNTDQKTNLSVTWILGGIATITTFLRLYVRLFQQRNPGWDDLAMAFSWCFSAASASLATAAIHYGLGRDIQEITNPHDKMLAQKFLTLAPPSSIWSVLAGKLSIVLLFHRLLGVSMTKVRSRILWTLMAITACLSIAAIIADVTFCIPTEAIWDKSVRAKRCMSRQTQMGIWLAQASFNAFTDLVFGLLPTLGFYRLQMPLRRKIGLMMLFGIGIFGCVITSIKAYQLHNLKRDENLTSLFPSISAFKLCIDHWLTRLLGSWSPITIWNTAEMFVLITCANIPMVRTLFRRILNIPSSIRASYPLESTSATNRARARERYFSLDDSNSQDPASQRTGTVNGNGSRSGTVRNSFDRMYLITRHDSPPIFDVGDRGESGNGSGSVSESQRGIVKDTAVTVSVSHR
ncbi:uncharacterized protein BDV14DRAFT_196760 [Aspergillus stella-maris]|uniref:uncharacterized protein n=1 Tax=Aspergillus stella-maris TaxID=1810926 RepID=UPI003CCD7018